MTQNKTIANVALIIVLALVGGIAYLGFANPTKAKWYLLWFCVIQSVTVVLRHETGEKK